MMRFLILLCLCLGAITAFAEEIVPLRDWDDFQQRLMARGASAAEAQQRVDDLLDALRGMDRQAGADRIGVSAPPFKFDAWLNSEPMQVEDLRGQVVLVRWWTDTCPFCASSAPALRQLHKDYGSKGLTLIGVFHPKGPVEKSLDLPRVQRVVEQRNFEFSVAVDWDWRNNTLKDWWLTGPDRPATSVTFLLDQQGVIRFIHPGMEYHDDAGQENHSMCVDDMSRIRAEIERLLEDPVGVAAT
jgi:peroxiredoxin